MWNRLCSSFLLGLCFYYGWIRVYFFGRARFITVREWFILFGADLKYVIRVAFRKRKWSHRGAMGLLIPKEEGLQMSTMDPIKQYTINLEALFRSYLMFMLKLRELCGRYLLVLFLKPNLGLLDVQFVSFHVAWDCRINLTSGNHSSRHFLCQLSSLVVFSWSVDEVTSLSGWLACLADFTILSTLRSIVRLHSFITLSVLHVCFWYSCFFACRSIQRCWIFRSLHHRIMLLMPRFRILPMRWPTLMIISRSESLFK